VQVNCVAEENKPAHGRDRDLGPMTLEVEWDIYILTTYLHAENEVDRSSRSKVIARISMQIALEVKGHQTFNHLCVL